ncbi:ribonuclease [Neorhizobium lilium]|uniref:Ribonuclease n=1 Tax=Neorhizobium lilium TaxID=2503024 RepID=A0A3S3RH85_9HYPH|nr:ribonuclease [Neorhizobium lilium]RWX75846.1 ribonuclease [Neorhizobium lilium]
MKQFLTAVILACLATSASAQERRQPQQPGVFDFYVLALSWSPSFCSSQQAGKNDQQCGVKKDFGFIVHGLWPQNEKGYPVFCTTKEEKRVPTELGRPLFDIMPSMGLIGNEWRKHGTCTGLNQQDYFALVRKAYQKVRIPQDFAHSKGVLTISPDQIEDKFVAANAGLSRTGMSTSCKGRQFAEVRICLTKDLQFRECAEVDEDSCSAEQVTLPPVR